MEYLFSHKILCCGTLCTNKTYLPKNLSKDSDLKRGEYDYRVSKDDIVVYKWRDKVVHAISNFHGTEQSQVNRKNKDGTISQVACSEAIKHYNTDMGGVDKSDIVLCMGHPASQRCDGTESFLALLIDLCATQLLCIKSV